MKQKSMKRILTLIMVPFFLGIVPVACIDDCGSVKVQDFRIVQLGALTVNPKSQVQLDSTKSYPVDSVAKQFFIKERVNVAANFSVPTSFFINSAFACSPREPEAVHSIKSIQVISNKELSFSDANDKIEVGEIINDLFLISPHYYGTNNYISISEFVQDPGKIYDFLFYLKVGEKPYEPVTLDIDVVITMSDNTVLEVEGLSMKVE